jgi:hypothetical protein
LRVRTRRPSESAGRRWSGQVYLCVPRAWPDLVRRLTAGVPASRLHLPWVPLTNVNVAWGYLELGTAVEEARHRERRAGLLVNALPRESRTFSVSLEVVRDLRVRAEQRHFGLTAEDLLDAGPAGRARQASQAAWEEGVERLLVPSAVHHGGSLLVIFPGSLRPGSHFLPTSGMWIGGD